MRLCILQIYRCLSVSIGGFVFYPITENALFGSYWTISKEVDLNDNFQSDQRGPAGAHAKAVSYLYDRCTDFGK